MTREYNDINQKGINEEIKDIKNMCEGRRRDKVFHAFYKDVSSLNYIQWP